MQVISAKDYQDLSRKAAHMIIAKVRSCPKAVLGFATGGTPIGTYRALIDDFRKNGTSYKTICSVNLDEYIGLKASDPNSYHFYMDQYFFKYIDLPKSRQFIPDGTAKDMEKECRRYDRLIYDLGGVDLQLLGIGKNGHIGFNEPGTSFNQGTHVVELTASTRQANARFFSDPARVPTRAVTMGIGSILQSGAILLIVSGENKAETMRRLLTETMADEHFPASSLLQHPNVTVIADEAALALMPFRERSYYE